MARAALSVIGIHVFGKGKGQSRGASSPAYLAKLAARGRSQTDVSTVHSTFFASVVAKSRTMTTAKGSSTLFAKLFGHGRAKSVGRFLGVYYARVATRGTSKVAVTSVQPSFIAFLLGRGGSQTSSLPKPTLYSYVVAAGTSMSKAKKSLAATGVVFLRTVGRTAAQGLGQARFTAFIHGLGKAFSRGGIKVVPSAKGVPIVRLHAQRSGVQLIATPASTTLKARPSSVTLNADTQD